MDKKVNLYLDNSIFTFQKAGGVSIYWYELLKRLFNENHHFDTTLVKMENESINIFDKNIDYSSVSFLNENSLIHNLQRYLPLTKRIKPKSIYHSSYFRTSYQKDIVNIITIYDFAHDLGFSSGFPKKYANIWQKKQGILNADGIICISDNTRNDLLKLYPNVNPNKIEVIYLAVSNEFKVLNTKYEISAINESNLADVTKPFIVYIGERAAYKNFKIAVKTLTILDDYNLVIIGGGELQKEERNYLQNELPRRYLYLQGIHSGQLNKIFNKAFCLIYPSRYEGFGIPLIEAMQAGCPVITTNYASIPEVVGQAGLIVNEIVPIQFVEKITCLENQAYREKIVKMGISQASLFSWDKCHAETIKFYQKIYSSKFNL